MLAGSSVIKSHGLPSTIPRTQPKTISDKGHSWPLTFGLSGAVVIIDILRFWSMSPVPFNAAQMLNGTWAGRSIDDVDDEDSSMELGFDISSQISSTLSDVYGVLPINDDGTQVFVGQRPLEGALTFVPLQMGGMVWSASTQCGDAICAFALRRGELLISVLKKDEVIEYSLTKKDSGSSFLGIKSEASQHKVRYAIVIFVVVAFLKVALTKLQPPSAKNKRTFARRSRI
eukprot:GDKJ01059185.1.p1 GENE.GDKJ01059185.1~~GDKJ01059185.1.p1  ORF type:complete len:230 (-),score=10.73 GDKJ01059185.1:58-747(-)